VKELATQYRKSISLLNKGITKLKNEPSGDYIEERIKILNNMLNDLREVTKEIENYYKKGWWRSGKYTLNQNKPRAAEIYSEPIYNDSSNKQRRKSRNESLFGSGYSIVVNRKTKASN
jgi:hypothetical protein